MGNMHLYTKGGQCNPKQYYILSLLKAVGLEGCDSAWDIWVSWLPNAFISSSKNMDA